MGLVGVAAGILYSVGGLFIDLFVSLGWITSSETSGLSDGTLLTFGALIGMPLIFAAFGFLFGLLEGLLFNLFSRWLGIVELNLEW